MNTQQITEIFKSKGLKLTPQRIAVYKFLKENPIQPVFFKNNGLQLPANALRLRSFNPRKH